MSLFGKRFRNSYQTPARPRERAVVRAANSFRTMSDAVAVTKRRKITIQGFPDVISCVDDCVRALETALEAMDPPLEYDVHGGILQLIAEFAEPFGKWQWQPRTSATRLSRVVNSKASGEPQRSKTLSPHSDAMRMGREKTREQHESSW